MKSTVFDYKSYKAYLRELIAAQPKRGRGFRTALAQAASCQIAYVSQVLGGDRHFTFEQAEGINAFLGHGEDESRFFLLLVSLEKAGTPALKSRYRKEIDREIQKHLTLKDRFKGKELLTPEAQATYYSAWYYAAIHIAVMIERLQTKDALSHALGLKPSTVAQSLAFLVSVGLVEQQGNRYLPGQTSIYIGNNSPLISQHHTNWRMRSIASLDPLEKTDLHYSAVVSMNRDDFEKLKAHLVRAIEDARKIWIDSKNEDELCAVAVDFFKVAQASK